MSGSSVRDVPGGKMLRSYQYQHENVAYGPLSMEVEDGRIIEGDVDVRSLEQANNDKAQLRYKYSAIGVALSFVLLSLAFMKRTQGGHGIPLLGDAWSANFPPYSTVDPVTLGIINIQRDASSSPGAIFSRLRKDKPLPTNSWCESLFLGQAPNTSPENNVYQVPYIIDTAGPIQGVRAHPPHVFANDRSVMMTYEPENGLTLGAAEQFQSQHHVAAENEAIARLAVVLEWDSGQQEVGASSAGDSTDGGVETGPHMKAPIVRGAPYLSMEYFYASPRIVGQRFLSAAPVVDAGLVHGASQLQCGEGLGVFGPTITVQRELQLQFDTSDMTWLVFLSEPMEMACSLYIPPTATDTPAGSFIPGVVQSVDPMQVPYFELKAVHPVEHGMVRIAMANNCTTGQNRQYCDGFYPRDQTEYTALLRNHADAFPTGQADIQFTFPSTSEDEEQIRLIFNWNPQYMSQLGTGGGDFSKGTGAGSVPNGIPAIELIMFATPHHQERLRRTLQSSNEVIVNNGCIPTIHGNACLVLGSSWSMLEHLHPIGFAFKNPPHQEMHADIHKALRTDIDFELPVNYMKGAGDTYFSGKMLAKLARILLAADQMKGSVSDEKFSEALERLKSGVQVWLDGTASSPFLYDRKWGGMIMCGCDYDGETMDCANRYPDCPALVDAGQNFGAGFYNDHHFHFGYHIYAAAVAAKFDPSWGERFFQHTMLLVRDIANPSPSDPFFPVWRHKDWYLGFSWASGIVTIGGKPYPNGRNQESSSEAIHAYEAVALFGTVMSEVFQKSNASDASLQREAASRVRDMGRLLLATEIRSSRTYWHVQKRGTPGVDRVYPDVYSPQVTGMIWSLLVQEQTWFGNQPWKSYGIQLMPITVSSEQRDVPSWVRDMLPVFKDSCDSDMNCKADGWSVLVFACQATLGGWKDAWAGLQSLPDEVFDGAGGNGHSRTNSLMHIATRGTPSVHDFELGNAFGEPDVEDNDKSVTV